MLKRAITTLHHVLDETDLLWIPVTKAWELNERHYGGLTGLDKVKTVEKHGEEQVSTGRVQGFCCRVAFIEIAIS